MSEFSLKSESMADDIYQSLWNEDMSVCMISCAFLFHTKVAHLFFADNGCSDMGGAISFCEHVMPDVLQIQTFNASGSDTVYDKSSGVWRAH